MYWVILYIASSKNMYVSAPFNYQMKEVHIPKLMQYESVGFKSKATSYIPIAQILR